jgi:AcrR family transcriptional regulator
MMLESPRVIVDEAEGVGRPIDRRRAQTRNEILSVAWDICHDEGLAALSLRALASRVGMRAPSLYSYFGSKDAIYDAMFAQGQRQLGEHMADAPDTDLTRADLKTGTRAFFEFCTSDPVRYQLMFQRTIPGFEPSSESYALAVAHLARFNDTLRSLGVDDPHLHDLWTALITGLIDQQVSNDPGGTRWARLLDEAVDVFCDHAGVPPSPPTTASPPTRKRRP